MVHGFNNVVAVDYFITTTEERMCIEQVDGMFMA